MYQDLTVYNNITAQTIDATVIGANLTTALLNLLCPVGTVVCSQNSPASVLGGTWQQIEDTFILGSGETYTYNATGGSATQTLTSAQMPSHNHNNLFYNAISNDRVLGISGGTYTPSFGGFFNTANGPTYPPDSGNIIITGTAGGGQPFDIMPPYTVKTFWERVE